MNTLELFAGTKSFSKVMAKHNHQTFTVDNNKESNPDLCKDIMEVSLEDLPKDIDVLWASPPCQTFSIAAVSHYCQNGFPKNIGAITGRALLYKTLWLIEKIKPKYWFIENPRGMMRKEGVLIYLQNCSANRKTITYCQYGDKRMKPTDIWTNCNSWIPKPPCSNGSSCHEKAPRGSKTGTQGLKGDIERGIIPESLFEEILGCINKKK